MANKMPIGQFVAELEKALNRKDGYIMGATGQDPKQWSVNSWWFNQYRDGDYTEAQYQKALYWREHAARVWDCNGMAEGIYKDFSGVSINTKARFNYAEWCSIKGTGLIPVANRKAGMAVFWGNSASTIHHVAYLYKPVDASVPTGDWYLIEARGVAYGVVKTKLYSRKPNFWGMMDKYFDYGDTSFVITTPDYKLGDRILKKGMTGDDVKELQSNLIQLGYSCGSYGIDGDFGSATESAVKLFQKANGLTVDGEVGTKTIAKINELLSVSGFNIKVTGGSVNVRTAPNITTGQIIKVVHRDDVLKSIGTDSATGWYKLEDGNYISNKYTVKV